MADVNISVELQLLQVSLTSSVEGRLDVNKGKQATKRKTGVQEDRLDPRLCLADVRGCHGAAHALLRKLKRVAKGPGALMLPHITIRSH